MVAWLVEVFEVEDVVLSWSFGAALAGAANPATARMPVIRSVAASFFIAMFPLVVQLLHVFTYGVSIRLPPQVSARDDQAEGLTVRSPRPVAHYTGIADNGYRSLEENQKIQYEVGQGANGPVAQNICLQYRTRTPGVSNALLRLHIWGDQRCRW